MRFTRRALLGTAATTVAVAGCLSDEEDGGGDGTTPAETTDGGNGTIDGGDETTDEAETTDASNPTVQVRSHEELGDVLVGPEGMTLYNFDRDEQGAGESTCYDGCAESWPPLTVGGEPTVGDDVTAEITTFEREDGSTQVAANGWPLYYFAPDERPGDANGQGANDVWWVLRPDGSPVRGA